MTRPAQARVLRGYAGKKRWIDVAEPVEQYRASLICHLESISRSSFSLGG